MFIKRLSKARGYFGNEWLQSYHTFSFGEYFDRQHMHFYSLRVINDDTIAASAGFPTHPHRDMEIITYVFEGAVAHRDSLGSQGVTAAGDVQVMTAGRGIQHSEFNPSNTETLRLLQIWIMPEASGLEPRYDQKKFSNESKQNNLQLVVSHDGRENSLRINQDLNLYATILTPGSEIKTMLEKGRAGWVQIVRGSLQVSSAATPSGSTTETGLETGDGLAVEKNETAMGLIFKNTSEQNVEFLYFDLL